MKHRIVIHDLHVHPGGIKTIYIVTLKKHSFSVLKPCIYSEGSFQNLMKYSKANGTVF